MEGPVGENNSSFNYILRALCLAAIPFNTASGRLFIRELRDLSEITLGAYIIFTLEFFYLPILVMASGSSVTLIG